jgi:integrase
MKKIRFPHSIRRGSVTVKVYKVRQPRAKEGIVYTVAWHAGGRRLTRQISDLKRALEEAALKAEQMAAGRIEAASLTGDDAVLLIEARKITRSTPILTALEEWARAIEITGGDLLGAAKAWKDAHGTKAQAVDVAKAVDVFIAAKRRAGVDVRASYLKSLPRLKEQLGGRAIGSISAHALEQWIHQAFKVGEAKHAHPVTFNTVRKRVVSLWRWCRKQGYLPRNVQTEAEQIEFAREQPAEIGIFSLVDYAEVLELMRTEHPLHVGVAVLAGFCGLRRTEIHAQRWDDVYLDRGFLRVTKAKKNTPSKRLVQLSPAAVEWLMLCDRSGELVSPPWGMDRIRTFARDAGILTPENGFRHAYISHRVAMTGNVAETSHEAGNSPEIVHRHYRELVEKGEGSQWFDLTPKRVKALVTEKGKVVAYA